tara:strand:- start:15461 stop:15754 length:294 start_codon:yes stop_codon:yes gene_type:complete
MATKTYIVAENWGKGFITHEDNASFSPSGFPANVWQVPATNRAANLWIAKVLGTVKTRAEAQALVDAEITAAQAAYDALSEEEKAIQGRPEDITLEE